MLMRLPTVSALPPAAASGALVAILASVLLMSGCDDRSARGPNPSGPLNGKRIAILATDGVEESELREPRKALDDAGATTLLVSIKGGRIHLWNHGDWGDFESVDSELAQARADSFDGLLLPGGVMNPDALRLDAQAVAFATAFVTSRKPIAAICHGPWLLIEAGGVKGKTMTSWPSLRDDLTNAGAMWVDQEVVRSGELVTSRKPADIPEFDRQIILLFAGR
jgi:protease I